MKTLYYFIVLFTLLSGCKKQPELHIYTWVDYIDPEFVSQFEQENNCKVIIDSFDSNETMFIKLMSGANGYDICCPTEYYIQVLKNANLIEKLDKSKLGNVFKNFDKRFLTNSTDRLEWHVPYAFSCTGILYRKDKFPDAEFKTWDDMFNKKFNNRVCIMNDIREIIGLALKQNKYSVNSTSINELSVAINTAKKWKLGSCKMDNEAYKFGIASGEFNVAMGYNSDANQLISEMPDEIGFIIPECGTTSSIDTFVIMKNSKNKELAYKFINALYKKENAVKNSEYICAPMLINNLTETLNPNNKNVSFMNISDEMLNKCENILDIGDNLNLYNNSWDEIKNN